MILRTFAVKASPDELAELFWSMGSDDQAEFFAHLHRVAGHRLCMQMAYVARHAAELYRSGIVDARHGLESVAGHGETMRELQIDLNVDEAKREISRMVRGEPA